MRHLIFFAVAFTATQAAAETVEIEMNGSAALIRCYDTVGHAECEMVFESADEIYTCIAFDVDAKPIATGLGNGGSVIFQDLDHTLIADVKCR